MRNKQLFTILTAFWFALGSTWADQPDAVGYYLFTDRTWALSGDTVWFRLAAIDIASEKGNVVHVELENLNNQPVSRVTVVTTNGSGKGYLPVPDTMQTGVYWLYAYTSSMRNSGNVTIPARLLTVYHRFEESFGSIDVPMANPFQFSDQIIPSQIINVDKPEAKPRETITVTIDTESKWVSSSKKLVISAFVENPIHLNLDSFFWKKLHSGSISGAGELPPEVNSFLIEGRVVPFSGNELPTRSLVLLAISDSVPWFDYYVAQSDGYFRFNMKNLKGTATIYLRAIAEDNLELGVELQKGMMKGSGQLPTKNVQLSEKEAEKVKTLTEAVWYEKIFAGDQPWHEVQFEAKQPYAHPFYGKPDRRVIPAEFIDLPDFQEISRELLPGVRYRRRGNTSSVQLMNNTEKTYFDQNPLRLINGIPFFDDGLLFRLKSTDIQYIDIIHQERVFGDLSFKGVLSISLHDRENSWTSGQKTLFPLTIPCLQIYQSPSLMIEPAIGLLPGQPDFRRVFLFEEPDGNQNLKSYTFRSSDIKGNIVIKLQGITCENRPFEITRKIEVK